MQIINKYFDSVLVIKLDQFKDNRGFFSEFYHKERYESLGIKDRFIQDNHSRSSHNVLRGLHYTVNNYQAQLMTAFCYYKSQFHDDSLDALERFIALYPGSKKISYAYYLRALNYFEQISDVERDQTTTAKAKKAFNEVINKFPEFHH